MTIVNRRSRVILRRLDLLRWFIRGGVVIEAQTSGDDLNVHWEDLPRGYR